MLAVLAVQVATYVVLGLLYVRSGNWRYAVAQLLLAAVQAVIYG
jgi:hypothetical protein